MRDFVDFDKSAALFPTSNEESHVKTSERKECHVIVRPPGNVAVFAHGVITIFTTGLVAGALVVEPFKKVPSAERWVAFDSTRDVIV